MICGQFRFEPVVGVPLVTRLQAEADRIHREARRTGSTESWQAHAADALAAMTGEGGVRPQRTKVDVVFVVDLRTFRHDEHPETVSHIVGGGPVVPEVVREMAKDAFLKVVFHDGVNIHTIAHLGRYIPAELRTPWSWVTHQSSTGSPARGVPRSSTSSGTTSIRSVPAA